MHVSFFTQQSSTVQSFELHNGGDSIGAWVCELQMAVVQVPLRSQQVGESAPAHFDPKQSNKCASGFAT
jgi:hypothetical protein